MRVYFLRTNLSLLHNGQQEIPRHTAGEQARRLLHSSQVFRSHGRDRGVNETPVIIFPVTNNFMSRAPRQLPAEIDRRPVV
jgi:hypothetical protein